MDNYLEHMDLGDGESAELLTRLPYDRSQMIEEATERDEAITQAILTQQGGGMVRGSTWSGWADTVMRAHLWSARLKNDLTGEDIGADQIGMANGKKVDKVRLRAVALYVEWVKGVQAGPKGSSGTDSPTPPSESPEPSETSA